LGTREPDVYGNNGFDDYFSNLQSFYPNIKLTYFQSNVEGELISEIQRIGFDFDGIVLNAAAYTHTSVGIGDAIKAISAPVVEVHISNTFAREDFRHTSFITPNAKGLILGFGLDVYRLAVESFLEKS
jgi:3-dehydroquinate dehydratase-2